MKKILIAMVLFIFVALPMSAMAIETISDNDLSAVTGQSGVSIGADITMNISATTIAWGDADGFTGAAAAGWVGLSSLVIDNLRMHMRSDAGMADGTVAFTYYSGLLSGAKTFSQFLTDISGTAPDLQEQKALLTSILVTNQFLTIDVGTAAGVTKLRIGLPTFEIDMASMAAAAGLWDDNAGVPGTFQKLGDIYVSDMKAYVGKNNFVDISKNDTASGVLINVGNTGTGNMIDTVTVAAASWGDSDGLGGAGLHAGYVGIKDLTATAIKVAATLNINVATPNGAGVPGLLAMDQSSLLAYEAALPGLLAANDRDVKDLIAYMLHNAGVIGTTSVDIALTANINVGTMVATAALGTNNLLTAGTQNTLGKFYLNNLNLTIPSVGGGYAASWVSISAH